MCSPRYRVNPLFLYDPSHLIPINPSFSTIVLRHRKQKITIQTTMKSSKLTLVLSVLVFAFVCTASSIAAQDATPEPVLDIDGGKLRVGTQYYILPVFRGRGGGIAATNKTCPVDVVQDRLEVSNGLPVTFSPAYDSKGDILVSADLNVKFSSKNKGCSQSTVWKIQKSANSKIQWFVTTGGVEGNPGFDTVYNWFKIEKFDKDYKLKYCPRVCRCGDFCRDIGIYIEDNGVRTLSLSDALQPFKVKFKKAQKV